MYQLLVVDDEAKIREVIREYAEFDGYEVTEAEDGMTAIGLVKLNDYDLIILDIMMPKLDGLTVLRRLREAGDGTPILLLTARSETDDKVLGLDSGANDYLTKPFHTQELLARVRAMTRSHTAQPDTRLRLGSVTLDRASFALTAPGGSVRLTNREFQILELLMANPRCVIPTERFLEKIWGFDAEVEANVLWVYISNLRKKLAALGADVQIRTSRNAGFSLEETP